MKMSAFATLFLLLCGVSSLVVSTPVHISIGQQSVISQLNFYAPGEDDQVLYSVTNYRDGQLFLETGKKTLGIFQNLEATEDVVQGEATIGVNPYKKNSKGTASRREAASLLAINSTSKEGSGSGSTAGSDASATIPLGAKEVATGTGHFAAEHVVINDALNVHDDSNLAAPIPQWKWVIHEDYDIEDPTDKWSEHAVQSCSDGGNKFLGGPCRFAEKETEKLFSGLPTHSWLRLQANFHFFDQWEGENAYAKLDGDQIWRADHHHCSGSLFADYCKSINVCGADAGDTMGRLIDVTIPHSGSSVTVAFGSTLSSGACTASWGLDDVKIAVQ